MNLIFPFVRKSNMKTKKTRNNKRDTLWAIETLEELNKALDLQFTNENTKRSIRTEWKKRHDEPLDYQLRQNEFDEYIKQYNLTIVSDHKKGTTNRILRGKCKTEKCDFIVQKSYSQFLKTGCLCTSCITKSVTIIRKLKGEERQSKRLQDEETTGVFTCPKCKEKKPNSENTRQKQKKRLCKSCRKKQKEDDNFFSHLVRHAEYRNKNRNDTGRDHKFDIDVDYIQQLWNIQNGRCSISGVAMVKKTTCDWQCSIDRIDNTLGYVKSNVRLVCLEFQHGRHQWTTEMWHEFCCLFYGTKSPTEDENKFLTDKVLEGLTYKSVRQRKNPVKSQLVNGKYKCTECNIFKNEDEFSKHHNHTRCKTCVDKYLEMRRMTLRGRLSSLLNSARQHTKERYKKKTLSKRDDLSFDITLDFLFDLYYKQSGRCYYSGICMTTFKGSYLMSLERKDPKKGYTKSNVVLICDILNTGDFRVNSDDSSRGSGGWSKNKVKHAITTYKNVITPIERTCIDIFKNYGRVETTTSTQLTIDSIIADFKKNKKWCSNTKQKTENGIGMKNAIQNIRHGVCFITEDQRRQLLECDRAFFDKKRDITSHSLSMQERVDRLVQYFEENKKFPPNSYVMSDGYRLGRFKVNTRRKIPKSMSNDDKQKILKCDPMFFRNTP